MTKSHSQAEPTDVSSKQPGRSAAENSDKDSGRNFYLDLLQEILPRPTSAAELGRRATQLREYLGLTIGEVAARASLPEEGVARFEESGEGTVALFLALARAVSSGDELERVLITPKFTTIDEVVSYERKRLAKRQRIDSE